MDKWLEILPATVNTELKRTAHKDGSHDFGHVHRVSYQARRFIKTEKGNELVVFAASMFHDIVSLPKNHPEASQSSFYAATRAKELLTALEFPGELIPGVFHAIHAHSFSAAVEPKTVEAKCLQDADRMEALGALGLMRVFYCSGMWNSEILNEMDPAGDNRTLNDKEFALDHFVLKLMTLQRTMKTRIGRETAMTLSQFLADYRIRLIQDHLAGRFSSGPYKIAQVFRRGGQQRLVLLHPKDPLGAGGRSLAPQLYALDRLLQEKDSYIQEFTDQLCRELNVLSG